MSFLPLPRLVLVAAIVALVAPSASAAGIVTGIFDPFAVSTKQDLKFARTHDEAGASLTRLMLNWRLVAPMEPADPTNPDSIEYKWGAFDAAIESAVVQHHLIPVVNIVLAPDWAEGRGTGREGTVRPSPTALADFATAAARRYSGTFTPTGGTTPLPRVRYWLIWNEPNLASQLNPQRANGSWASPGIYRKLVNAAGSAIRGQSAADHQPRDIIAGATAPFGHAQNPAPKVFMRKLLCLDARNKPVSGCGSGVQFDIWAHHPYTNGGPTHHARSDNDVSFGDLPEMRSILKAAARAGHIASTRRVGFWVTEMSWDSRPPDSLGVKASLEARWVSEALYRAQSWGVGALLWFLVSDQPLSTSQYQSGLWYCGLASSADDGTDCSANSDQPKTRVLTAFNFPFVAFDGNRRVRVWGRTPLSQPGTVQIERHTSNGWRAVGAELTTTTGFFSKKFSSSLTKGSWRATFVDTDINTPDAHSVGFSLKAPKDITLKYPFGCGGDGLAC